METVAFFMGLLAVAMNFLSYLQKKKKNIIVINATARLLYITQYVLLCAFEGVVLNVAGIISSFLAQKKDKPFVQKHLRFVILGVNALIIIMGLTLYKNVYSLLPIVGVLLHTGAFWLDSEKKIRQVSFLGSPFWLIYNLVNGAYGSCIGDALSIISIGISIVRYDLKPNKKV